MGLCVSQWRWLWRGAILLRHGSTCYSSSEESKWLWSFHQKTLLSQRVFSARAKYSFDKQFVICLHFQNLICSAYVFPFDFHCSRTASSRRPPFLLDQGALSLSGSFGAVLRNKLVVTFLFRERESCKQFINKYFKKLLNILKWRQN